MKAKAIFWLLFILLALWVWKKVDQHVVYGFNMLRGQSSVILNAEPVDSRLNDPQFPDSLKAKIRLIQAVKQFAVDSLGFPQTNNYSSYYQEPRHTLLWMLTGCRPFAFEEKEWCFPVLGCFGYKGFFDSTSAIAEMLVLEAEGYEPDLGPVAAWSTLGILPDPILSSMLAKEDWKLIQLVFHELFHTCVYAKGEVDLNENLANFVGDNATLLFIRTQFPDKTDWHRQVEEAMQDRQLFLAYMFKAYRQLDSLYKQWPKNLGEEAKQQQKRAAYDSIFEGFKLVNFQQPQRYSYLLKTRDAWTNNLLLGYRRYDFSRPELENIYQKQARGNLRRFVQLMKHKYGSRGLFSWAGF
jgi:predicted aminopeptidase